MVLQYVAAAAFALLTCTLGRQVTHGKSAEDTQPGELTYRELHSGFRQHWDQCGNWKDRYQKLHADILAGHAAQMYLIAEPKSDSGLADSLVSIATLLYISVLTDRALLIRDSSNTSSILMHGYDQPRIKWAANPALLDLFPSVAIEQLRTSGPVPTGDEINKIRYGNLDLLGEKANVVTFANCNAGLIHDLFKNVQYARRLYEMGVRPETAFSCAFWYLFSPSQAVRSKFARTEAILASSNSINIGIQIRAFYTVGHDNFTGAEDGSLACDDIKEAEQKLALYDDYFRCAETVEASLKRSQGLASIRWFVVSDSAKVRNCAATLYGSKIIGHTHQEKHLAHIRINKNPEDAVIDSVGDQLMLAMTDHIVAKYGGFGKLAALIQSRWHSYFLLPPHSHELNATEVEEVCSKALTFDEMADVPPGVR